MFGCVLRSMENSAIYLAGVDILQEEAERISRHVRQPHRHLGTTRGRHHAARDTAHLAALQLLEALASVDK